jgi:hypothetical protein
MNLRKTLARLTCACAASALLVPAGALAHDGTDGSRDGRFGHHHFHHFVVLKGTVNGVDTDSGVITIQVAKASGAGKALVGKTATVKVFKTFVADVNNDGAHNLADVAPGDTVFVKTLHRFIDTGSNTISAAKVLDLSRTGSFTSARRSEGREGRCDHR